MRKTDEEIAKRRRERFELMVVRLANHRGLSSAKEYCDLPISVKETFEAFDYIDVIKPLIQIDYAAGQSYRQLSNKYAIPKTTISRYISK